MKKLAHVTLGPRKLVTRVFDDERKWSIAKKADIDLLRVGRMPKIYSSTVSAH